VDGHTIPEVADRNGVGRRELREAVEQGLIPATYRDGRWLLRSADLTALRVAETDPEPAGDELDALHRRVERLEQRVAELEGEPPPTDDDPSMRSALTPLFRGPAAS
jgi:hypothetical protein